MFKPFRKQLFGLVALLALFSQANAKTRVIVIDLDANEGLKGNPFLNSLISLLQIYVDWRFWIAEGV